MHGQGPKKGEFGPSGLASLSSTIAFRQSGHENSHVASKNQVSQGSLSFHRLSQSEGSERGCNLGLKPARGTSPSPNRSSSKSHTEIDEDIVDAVEDTTSGSANDSILFAVPRSVSVMNGGGSGKVSATKHLKQKKLQLSTSIRIARSKSREFSRLEMDRATKLVEQKEQQNQKTSKPLSPNAEPFMPALQKSVIQIEVERLFGMSSGGFSSWMVNYEKQTDSVKKNLLNIDNWSGRPPDQQLCY